MARRQILGAGERFPRALVTKESPSGQELPEHDPGGVDVGSAVDGQERELLGSHVAGLSLDDAMPCELRARDRLRNTKIGDARTAVRSYQNVLRRYVAMNKVERLTVAVDGLVRRVQTHQYIAHDLACNGRG